MSDDVTFEAAHRHFAAGTECCCAFGDVAEEAFAEVGRLRADLADARGRIVAAIGRLSEDDDEQLAIVAILSGYPSEDLEAALSAGGGDPAEGGGGE